MQLSGEKNRKNRKQIEKNRKSRFQCSQPKRICLCAASEIFFENYQPFMQKTLISGMIFTKLLPAAHINFIYISVSYKFQAQVNSYNHNQATFRFLQNSFLIRESGANINSYNRLSEKNKKVVSQLS